MDLRKDDDLSYTEMTSGDAAAWWFARIHSPDVSDSVLKEFDAWCAESQDHAAAYAKVQQLWDISRILIEDVVSLDTVVSGTVRSGRFYRTLAAIAATLLLASGVWMAFRWPDRTGHSPPIAASNVGPRSLDSEAEYSTGSQGRSSIALPDGSLVVLNTNSEIKVAYTENERAIGLIRGQALFEVAKHQKRPFFVYAGDRRVIATGTAFDVRVNSAARSVEITLVEGSVVVDRPTTDPKVTGLRATLRPGERLVARAGLPPQILRSDDVTNWRTDRMVFSDSPLSAVVAALNRYGGPQILLSDERLGDLRVEGTLRTDDPAAVAHAIAEIYSLRIAEENQQVIRLGWK